jgi:Helicase associated domain
MTMSRHEALTWFQRGFQAGQISRERADFEQSVAEFRAQYEADQQASLGRLVMDLVDVLAEALLEDDQEWQRALAAAAAYRAERGHLWVPRYYVTADGYQLGLWMNKQRVRKHRGVLLPSETAALDDLGMIWRLLPPRSAQPPAAVPGSGWAA